MEKSENIYKVSKELAFFNNKNVTFIGDSVILDSIKDLYSKDTEQYNKKESSKVSYVFSDHKQDDEVMTNYFKDYKLKLFWGADKTISLYEKVKES